MRNDYALRFLLLRSLKECETAVAPRLFQEVVDSLCVTAGQDAYVVSWKADGNRFERRFDRSRFAFYQRGDLGDAESTPILDVQIGNSDVAREFAKTVFSIVTYSAHDMWPRDHRFNRVLAFGIMEAGGLVLALFMGRGIGAQTAALLFLLFLLEFTPHGRFYCSLLWLGLVFQTPVPTLLGASAYGALQYVDPNSFKRGLRVFLTITAALLGAAMIALTDGVRPPTGLLFAALLFAAPCIAFLRSLYGVHFRVMPLAAPFFCAGLASVKGTTAAALVGLIYCGVSVVLIHIGGRIARSSRTPRNLR